MNDHLKNRYLFTVASHKIFMELNSLRTTSHKGKITAENNVKVMIKYNSYFQPTKEGTRYFLLIELAKFFEKDSQLSLYGILGYMEKNINVLGRKHYEEFHKDKTYLLTGIDTYESLTQDDILRFRRRLKANREKIITLKGYRDQYIAHDDLKKKKYVINSRDVSVLLKIVRDIIDFNENKFEKASTDYNNFESVPVKNVGKLFKDLREYDKFRKEKWRSK